MTGVDAPLFDVHHPFAQNAPWRVRVHCSLQTVLGWIQRRVVLDTLIVSEETIPVTAIERNANRTKGSWRAFFFRRLADSLVSGHIYNWGRHNGFEREVVGSSIVCPNLRGHIDTVEYPFGENELDRNKGNCEKQYQRSTDHCSIQLHSV